MTESRSRRGLLALAVTALTALVGWSTSSKLSVAGARNRALPLGRKKERSEMSSEANTTTLSTTSGASSAGLRKVDQVLRSASTHWVGDGFLVRSVISPDGDPRVQSPFLLLDHAARRRFEPSATRRGVGEHPHRGFETVTFAYQGEVDHRDSSGGGGTIGPGDVQWMTAASGIVHEEMHSQRFSEQGGEFEMVQLWVNLPARDKMSTPGYQSLLDRDFPRVRLGAAEARVVAGSLGGVRGPARTHTPITIFDLRFTDQGSAEFELPEGFTSLSFTLEGEVHMGADARHVTPGQLAVWDSRERGQLRIHGAQGARVLVLSGEPIDEPVAAYGPFVMNTREQILAAVRDYQSGKMGHLREGP